MRGKVTKEWLLAAAQMVQIVQLTHERGKMMLHNASEICINIDTVYIGIPDHLTCLLRNLYTGQEATVRTLYEQPIGSRLRKSTTGLTTVTVFA